VAAEHDIAPQSPKAVAQIHEVLASVQLDLRSVDRNRLDAAARKQYEHVVFLVDEVLHILKEAKGESEMDALSLARQAAVEVATLFWAQMNGSEYARQIDRYRAGDVKSIVTAEWTASDLATLQEFLLAHKSLWGRPGSPVEKFDDLTLAAAVMLHTDSVVYLRMPGEHLEAARRLLAAIDDDSLPPRFKRNWYLAVAGYLQGELSLVPAVAHVDDAVARFPDDPDILTAAGALNEFIASPGVDLSPPPRSQRAGPLENAHWSPPPVLERRKRDGLKLAEEFYRKTLTSDPRFAEAHLRLGRVLYLSGRLDAALEECRLAATVGDARVRYLASLFAGAVREANGQRAEAVAAYREAGRECPGCPSASIALSHALYRDGQRDAATVAIDAALAGKEVDLRADPWWSYPLGPFWQRDDLLAALRKAVR
jgi:tetratricopeptide (TPR) repeat protein